MFAFDDLAVACQTAPRCLATRRADFTNGVWVGQFVSAKTEPIESLWIPFAVRRRAHDQKREAVLRLAIELFLKQGYHRTVLGEIAKRLNITKPALYNYFDGKEGILIECFIRGQQIYEANVAAIDSADSDDGLSKLRNHIRVHIRAIASDFGACVTRLDDRELSPRLRTRVRAAKRRITAAFCELIVEGIADGSIRPCEPKLTTLLMLSALNGINDWYRPDGELSIEAIAEECMLWLTQGVTAW
jgi:AcrR family transcriptional regulator